MPNKAGASAVLNVTEKLSQQPVKITPGFMNPGIAGSPGNARLHRVGGKAGRDGGVMG